MAGDIFYSNVDANLRKELNARAEAGFSKRSPKHLDFAFGKISNVEIKAYDGSTPSDKNLAKSFNDTNIVDPLSTLGGKNVQSGAYMPSNKSGYLISDNRPGYRIPPVITLAEINIGDHSMGLLNKATVNITIPDPTADFDDFERIWFRPGRHATVLIECPDSAIITTEITKEDGQTGGLLENKSIPTAEKLKQQFDDTEVEDINKSLKKMNRVRFDGLITSFQFTFQQDGSVECTISMTGTSNVYTDVSLLLPGSDNSENVENVTLYKLITDIVELQITQLKKASNISKKCL